ncbi:MAG TPA: diacylglycerol kinase family protein [Candidatus Sulfomarinibacteraceae bacterium]|nr:diacylglycerol kinase family protein [Candidatus Sulfomarinibacteraceae bacterium]
MKATLIYNTNARATGQVSEESLQDALRDAGYEPVYQRTESEYDLDGALASCDGGLVVTVGGDGTVRAVATRLLGRDVKLSLIPLGTANNIARTFGIEGDPHDIISALADPFECDFDVGKVTTPWGEHYFLEAMGFGFYADTLAEYGPDQPKSILRAIAAFTKTLPEYDPKPFEMALDGQDISGDYLLVEVLNTTAFGPRLRVAPKADTGDGLFEVIRIQAQERDNFFSYIMSIVAEELDELPSVVATQGRRLELAWKGFPLHIDGEVHPNLRERPSARRRRAATRGAKVVAEVLPQALKFWLPHEPM